jgi:hypothetical protein
MIRTRQLLAIAAVFGALGGSALAADQGETKMPMNMPMSDAPAHFKPTRSAYSEHHLFLVKLLEVPTEIAAESGDLG